MKRTPGSEDIFQEQIKKTIPLINAAYKYRAESGINPAYENIQKEVIVRSRKTINEFLYFVGTLY